MQQRQQQSPKHTTVWSMLQPHPVNPPPRMGTRLYRPSRAPRASVASPYGPSLGKTALKRMWHKQCNTARTTTTTTAAGAAAEGSVLSCPGDELGSLGRTGKAGDMGFMVTSTPGYPARQDGFLNRCIRSNKQVNQDIFIYWSNEIA